MAITEGLNIVLDNLVLHLDGGNAKSYPGSGTTWFCLNNSLSATLFNGVSYSNLNYGSLQFDGSNDYCQISTQFNNSAATWSCWFNPDTFTADGSYSRRIMHQSDGAGDKEINITHSGGSVGFAGYNGAYLWQLGANLTNINTWYNVVGTYSGTQAQIYLNGELQQVAAQTGAIGSATLSFTIGAVSHNTSVGRYSGKIAAISIYNTNLTAPEIKRNFQAMRGRFGI